MFGLPVLERLGIKLNMAELAEVSQMTKDKDQEKAELEEVFKQIADEAVFGKKRPPRKPKPSRPVQGGLPSLGKRRP
jgi:hypothetical protein